ncbi:MAG: translation elongation factor Ts, partial [Candidatus Aenigmarchaeota archaeon]|nr:translation elongation factor Ts [Candidatus Aenigmarchaeota archaeon]
MVTTEQIKELRDLTGISVMQCKKALEEAGGDMEKAKVILQKKGSAVAGKKADRTLGAGAIQAYVHGTNNIASVVVLSCETDFVAKNEEFVAFANNVMDLILTNKPGNIDVLKALKLNGATIESELTEMVGKTGEKMELAGYECINAENVAAYNHMGNKLATILGLNKSNTDDTGHQLAMQVAAMNPVAVDKENLSQEVIDKEIEIGKDIARQEGKKEELLEKIAM